MRLWTIQPVTVWEQIRERGEARVDSARWDAPDFTPPSYAWLAGQLAKRRICHQGGYPWWCYCKKPDLRWYRHGFLAGGPDQVRLELEIDEERVQVFRIWAWDRVYCGMYLGTRLQERAWTRRRRAAGLDPDLHDSELDEPWRTELQLSWERVFTALPSRKNGVGKPGVQEAVVEVLRRGDVKKVDQFRTTYDTFDDYIASIRTRAAAGRL